VFPTQSAVFTVNPALPATVLPAGLHAPPSPLVLLLVPPLLLLPDPLLVLPPVAPPVPVLLLEVLPEPLPLDELLVVVPPSFVLPLDEPLLPQWTNAAAAPRSGIDNPHLPIGASRPSDTTRMGLVAKWYDSTRTRKCSLQISVISVVST
jgi:hypothetical protein